MLSRPGRGQLEIVLFPPSATSSGDEPVSGAMTFLNKKNKTGKSGERGMRELMPDLICPSLPPFPQNLDHPVICSFCHLTFRVVNKVLLINWHLIILFESFLKNQKRSRLHSTIFFKLINLFILIFSLSLSLLFHCFYFC